MRALDRLLGRGPATTVAADTASGPAPGPVPGPAPEAAPAAAPAVAEPLPQALSAPLETVHGTFLGVVGNRLGQTRHPRDRVYLVWEPGSDVGMVVTRTKDREFRLGARSPRAIAHLVRLDWRSDTTVAVADPWTRTWISPAPGATHLRAGRTTAGPDEILATHAPDGSAPVASPVATLLYAELRRHARTTVARADDVLATLDHQDPAVARTLFSALLPTLSRADLHELARQVMASPATIDRLAELYEGDVWITRSLPDLRTWLADRDASTWRTRTVGTDLDLLWRAGPGDVAASSGELLAFYARRQVEPRRRVCVVATARNEGVYLLEWVAYHRALGVDEIFVYSNNNEDGSDELLEALARAGAIRWLDSTVEPGTKAQAKAYAHAYSVLPEVLDFEWAMTVDIDEFLVLDPELFDGLHDFLDWHDRHQTDTIGVNWVVVGPSGLRTWSDDLVTRRFAHKVSQLDNHVKSISRPTRILGSQPHFPYTTEREHLSFREASGPMHTWHRSTLEPHLVQAQSDLPGVGHAALHHYALKSTEEFLWKFSRNRGGRLTATGDDGMALTLEEQFARRFLAQFDRDAGDARPAVEATVPDLESHVDALRRLEGVAEAEQHVKEAFVERSALVVSAYRDKLRDELGDPGRQVLALLEADASDED